VPSVPAIAITPGKRFGAWEVIRHSDRRDNQQKQPFWVCRCLCGVEREVRAGRLRRSGALGCGCQSRSPNQSTTTHIRRFSEVNAERLQQYEEAVRAAITTFQGRRFGSWVAEEFAELTPKSDGSYWLCRCVCGQRKLLHANNLKPFEGKDLDCTCVRLRAGAQKKSGLRRVIKAYKKGARERGLPWCLLNEEVADIIARPCSYCGSPPTNSVADPTTDRFFYNGIDRIDNRKGYVPENVVACCSRCNRAKSTSALSDFDAWLDQLVAFRSAAGALSAPN
jgi:5-methylcytosine-specific restriction endonuclease McrA